MSVVSFSLCEDAERFSFTSGFEEGRDRCPYDPAKGYTGLLVGMFPRDAFCHLPYVQFVSAVKAARRDGKHVFARKRRD